MLSCTQNVYILIMIFYLELVELRLSPTLTNCKKEEEYSIPLK